MHGFITPGHATDTEHDFCSETVYIMLICQEMCYKYAKNVFEAIRNMTNKLLQSNIAQQMFKNYLSLQRLVSRCKGSI